MKILNEQMDRIRTKMAKAYRLKAADTDPSDDSWRQNVMRSIRRIGPVHSKNNANTGFDRIVWRIAPAALGLMLLLAVLILRLDETFEYQISGIMNSDPVQQTFVTYDPL